MRGMLRPVYHGEHGLRTLRELARSYQTVGKDLNRGMNPLLPVRVASSRVVRDSCCWQAITRFDR